MQASHPDDFQRTPVLYGHSVTKSRFDNVNFNPMNPSGCYYSCSLQIPNFRRPDYFPSANNCPECMDPIFGIGFYHNGSLPNIDSVKSLTWSSKPRLTTANRKQCQGKGNLFPQEGQNSDSEGPEIHTRSRLEAKSLVEFQEKAMPAISAIPDNFWSLNDVQGAIANTPFRAEIQNRVLSSISRCPLQEESIEDSIQTAKEAQFTRDQILAMGSNHGAIGKDVWRQDQDRFMSCWDDRRIMQPLNSHIQHRATAAPAHASFPPNIKSTPYCQPYHKDCRLPPFEQYEVKNVRETSCSLQGPSNNVITEKPPPLIPIDEIPNQIEEDFPSQHLRHRSKFLFTPDTIPYNHRSPHSAIHSREVVVQRKNYQGSEYQNISIESSGPFGLDCSRDMTQSQNYKEKRQRHVAKPYDKHSPANDIHSKLLLFKYEEELLLRLKKAAEKNRENLLCLISRLLNPEVIPNAVTLLEVLKVCDLTELIKERILSVIREHIWQAQPRHELWETDHRGRRSCNETDVGKYKLAYDNDVSSQIKKHSSVTANASATLEWTKSNEDQGQGTFPRLLTTPSEPQKSSPAAIIQLEQNTNEKGNVAIMANEAPDNAVENKECLPSNEPCFEGDVDISEQVSIQAGSGMSENILLTINDMITTDRDIRNSLHPHKFNSNIDKVAHEIKQEEAVNSLKQCLEDFAASISLKEDLTESLVDSCVETEVVDSETYNIKHNRGSSRVGEVTFQGNHIKSDFVLEATNSEMELSQHNMNVKMKSVVVKTEPWAPNETTDDDTTNHHITMHRYNGTFPVITISPVAEFDKTLKVKKFVIKTETSENAPVTEVDETLTENKIVRKTEPCDTPCSHTTSREAAVRLTNNSCDGYWTDRGLLYIVKQEPEHFENFQHEKSDSDTSNIGNIFDKLLNR